MNKEKILEFLRDLQTTLADAYNTGYWEIFIDEAHGKVVDLIIELEKGDN